MREGGSGAFLLRTARLSVGPKTETLSGVERATLTGGSGDDTFDVSGWRGQASLAGGGGSDAVTLQRSGNFTLADGELRRLSPTNYFSLSGIERATLTGVTGRITSTSRVGRAPPRRPPRGGGTVVSSNDAGFT